MAECVINQFCHCLLGIANTKTIVKEEIYIIFIKNSGIKQIREFVWHIHQVSVCGVLWVNGRNILMSLITSHAFLSIILKMVWMMTVFCLREWLHSLVFTEEVSAWMFKSIKLKFNIWSVILLEFKKRKRNWSETYEFSLLEINGFLLFLTRATVSSEILLALAQDRGLIISLYMFFPKFH